MSESLVFSQSFEALLRAVGSSLSPESKERFRALGVNYDQRLLPAYPLEVWVSAMDLGSSLLLPGAEKNPRHFALGKRMVDTYGETLVGRALLAVMRVIGPRRTIERMTRNLRTTNNYTESTLETLPNGQLCVWCSKVISTEFYRGMFTRALESAGGREVKVELMSSDPTGSTFSVEWK